MPADIMQFVPILVVGFAASMGLTPLSRQIAMRLGVVDKPNQRKVHLDHKPMMGGLAIYAAMVLAVLLFSPARHLRELAMVLVGAAFLALVGLIDDRYELSARAKLSAQIVAILGIALIGGIRVNLFGHVLLDTGVTIIWMGLIINAINYMDNMDGLTAGISAIAAAFFMVIAIAQGLSLVSSLAAALLGSALGFLVHNFNPASTFMGDMGSMVLGFILSILAIKLRFDQPISWEWFAPVFVLALPLFDITLVSLTRIAEKRSPFQPGKDHTSHRFWLGLGLPPRLTLVVMYSLCALFGLLGYGVSTVPAESTLQVIGLGLGLLMALAVLMIWIRRRFQQPTASGTLPATPPVTPVEQMLENGH
jgi:UDP-GlcNAc:undecaprenyl-phosphate GlcNAc-1-phosphate transferase